MRQTFIFEPWLNRLDALHYHLGEHRHANVAMCMVALLDRSLPSKTMRDGFAAAANEIPRFKDRLRRVPGDVAAPVWEPDPDFDMDNRFCAVDLDPGAEWPAALSLLDDLQSTPFAPGHPPWSVLYIRNTPDNTSLVALKLHHVLSDGTALALMLSKVFMREALGDTSAAEIQAVGHEPTASIAREAVRHHRQAMADSVRAVGQALTRTIRDPSEVAFHARELQELAAGPRRWRVSDHSPRRHSAFFQIPLAAWRRAAEARQGRVNDLYIGVAAATVSRYLTAVGAQPDELAIVMPIDTRDDDSHQDGGNVTGAGILKLTGSDSELRDLREIARQARAAKGTADRQPESIVDALLALCPGRVQRSAVFRRFSTKDILATNVVVPLRCGLEDARADMVFIVPPVIGTPVSFALVGYDDAVHLAINMDLGLVAHPDEFERILAELLTEVCAPDAVTAISRSELPRTSRAAAQPLRRELKAAQ